jgi:hypothetical protein
MSSFKETRADFIDASSGGYRNSMQGARMSGRGTPALASTGYPDYRTEDKMGWLAAFSTGGYPDGIHVRGQYG